MILFASSNGVLLTKDELRVAWEEEVGVPKEAWGAFEPNGINGLHVEACMLFLGGTTLVDTACNDSTHARSFLCKINSTASGVQNRIVLL